MNKEMDFQKRRSKLSGWRWMAPNAGVVKRP